MGSAGPRAGLSLRKREGRETEGFLLAGARPRCGR